MQLLQGEGLSKTFSSASGLWRRPQQAVCALHNVSFHVDLSETVALVGGSGSGKSTLARIVTGLTSADRGTISWEGKSPDPWTPSQRARNIQMIFQDPYASLNPKLTIGTQLAEALRASGRLENVPQRGKEWLSKVGMPPSTLNAYPFQFSGGQRQRIAIARALAVEPRLLIADEPLSALDVTIQSQMLVLFKTLKTELQLTMLFISHDLAVVSEIADRMMVMQDGEIVEQGTPRAVLSAPQHPYTQKLLAALPQLPW